MNKNALAIIFCLSSSLLVGCQASDAGTSIENNLPPTKTPAIHHTINISRVSSGLGFSCAINAGKVKCWGKDDVGQTEVPQGIDTPTEISTGQDFACAINAGQVRCWGNNSDGQSNVPQGLKNPRLLSSSFDYSCVADDSGIHCWGINGLVPHIPSGIHNPQSLSLMNGAMCILDDDGVKCSNDKTDNVPVPQLINPRMIGTYYAGAKIGCAIDAVGLTCWRLDDDNTPTPAFPVVHNPKSITSSQGTACIVDDDGIKCAGFSVDPKYVPSLISVPDYADLDTLSVGSQNVCVLDKIGSRLQCWGLNEYGESKLPPMGIYQPSAIAISFNHICALDQEGVKCWGENYGGVNEVPKLDHPTEIATSDENACAIDSVGVHCWGEYWKDYPRGDFTGLRHPRKLNMSHDCMCVITDDGVNCLWGDCQAPPNLVNPTQVVTTMHTTYVLDRNGLHCSGLCNSQEMPIIGSPDLIAGGFNFTWSQNKSIWPSGITYDASFLVGGDDIVCASDKKSIVCKSDLTSLTAPSVTDPLQEVTALAAGEATVCAIDSEKIKCWGSDAKQFMQIPTDW